MVASPVQEIKDRLDVAEVIKGYITLQPAGRNLKGLCPFHKEKTPSFMVSPERQSWHCFGCGIGGDIFTFVMRYENEEFGEALRILAERAGVELKRVSPQEYKQFGLLYEINAAAKEFYTEQLLKDVRARAYLKERGVAEATVKELGIGFAPEAPDALTIALLKKGYDANDIIRAGLCIRTDRGLRIDRFRGRIMFPIHNHAGKPVGFTGRILPEYDREGIAKYVNSPETPIFAKSKLLYGFFASKPFIRESGKAFLVEGQMDFLMSWQAGIKNAVATSGTALTEDHLRAIRRMCDSLVLRFDTDEAGYAALERAIDLAEANDFGVRVVMDSVYKDPADAAQKDPEYLIRTIEEAIPAPEFYFRRYIPDGSKSDFKDREYIKRLRVVLGKLLHIASTVERNTWIQELSKKTGVSEAALFEEMEHVSPSRIQKSSTEDIQNSTSKERVRTRWEVLSERILAHAVAENDPSLSVSCGELLAPGYRAAAAALSSGARRSDDAEVDEMLRVITLAAELFPKEDIGALRFHLERESAGERRKLLTEKIRLAETRGDTVAVAEALSELANLPVV